MVASPRIAKPVVCWGISVKVYQHAALQQQLRRFCKVVKSDSLNS